jgi:hypothetical protein
LIRRSIDFARGAVVGIGSAYLPEAERLAAATDRGFFKAKSISDFRSRMAGALGHVVLVGAPGSLLVRDLNDFAASSPIPIGVISGTDLRETSKLIDFAIKPVFKAARRVICVDGIYESAFSIDTGTGLTTVHDPFNSSLHGLFHEEWNIATVCAHGSCNHLDLHSAVICGISDDASEWPRSSSGCWSTGNKRFCKRAPRGHAVHYLSDIKAKAVVVLTCSGFSLAGELYPSNASLVRSAEAGGASIVLTTLGLYVPQQWEAQHLTNELFKGNSVAATMATLNAYHHRRYGIRPYICFGDPLCRFEAHEPVVRAGQFPPAFMAIKRDHAIAVANQVLGNKNRQIVDRQTDARHVKAHADLSRLRLRLDDIWRFLCGLSSLLAEPDGGTEVFQARLPDIRRAHQELGEIVLRVLDQTELAIRGEFYTKKEFAQWNLDIATKTQAFDRMFSHFFLSAAFTVAVEVALVSGLLLLERKPGKPCSQCSCTQMIEVWGIGQQQLFWRRDCPTCGFQSIGPSETQAVIAKAPKHVRPGAKHALQIVAPAVKGDLAYSVVMKMKRRKKTFFSKSGTAKTKKIAIAFATPTDLPYDNHVVGWCTSHSLEIWYGRLLTSSTAGRRPVTVKLARRKQTNERA